MGSFSTKKKGIENPEFTGFVVRSRNWKRAKEKPSGGGGRKKQNSGKRRSCRRRKVEKRGGGGITHIGFDMEQGSE